MTPTNILSKLEELRRWQQKQQKRLIEQQQRTANDSYLTVAETKSKAHDCADNTPESTQISIVEETASNYPMPAPANKSRPKRPFLRKGSGLARFRMTLGDQFQPHTKPEPKVSTSAKHAAITPLKKPELSIKPRATWQASIEADKDLPYISNLESSDRELVIFETLEQRAMQSSFCSTNSSIVRLLSSTPHKSSPKKSGSMLQETIYARQQSDDSVVHLFNRQFSQQIIDDNARIVQENAQSLQDLDAQEEQIQHEYLNLIENAMKIKRLVSQGAHSDEDNDVTLSNEIYFHDDEKWSDSESSSTKSSNSIPVPKQDAQVMTEMIEACHIPIASEQLLLQEKLQKFEEELKHMQTETVKVQKLKEQLERQRREFEKHKKGIFKQMEEEKIEINQTLENEKKKLAKERMVFERYVKESQTKPSRKEREEITALKLEVSSLKETLKLKDSRNGTLLARLRSQIKNLEKANAALKAEVEQLTKHNARLVASQKLSRKSSDTKMLHEINKNLTKLAKEQFGKVSVAADKALYPMEIDKVTNSDELEKENDKNTINWEEKRDCDKSCLEETTKMDRTEMLLEDGRKQIHYKNGNIKTVSADGNHIILEYYNGDIKETNLLEGTVKYCYGESKVKHTTYADSSELLEFPDGQVEKRLKDGTCEVRYPNGIVRCTKTDGIEELSYPDGTFVTVNKKGEKTLCLPNGQKEVHTVEYKKREYPDGTIKILYPDGLQETRYNNGRIRLKDRQGKLLMDSENLVNLDN